MIARVLVAGGTGFIGLQCVRSLAARGHEVHVVARSPSPEPGVHAHPGDLLVPGVASALIDRIRPTHLLSLAWYATHGKFWTAEENLAWVGATLELVRAFAGAGGRRAVIAGSCAEYDWHGGQPAMDERLTPLAPHTLYGACKRAAHVAVEAYCRQAGVSLAWGRIFYCFGPGEAESRLVPSVILSLLRQEPARCSHGAQLRDFMSVEDLARAFIALLASEVEGPVNVASGQPTSIRSIVNLLADEVGRPDLLRFGALAAPAGDPAALVADVTRLRDEVGFAPTDDLRDGLRRTIEWWRGQRTGGQVA